MNKSPSILKPLSILEEIASTEHAPSLAQLTLRARQPKATLHRWLANLEGAGLVQHTLDGRGYELGARASRLAFSILANKSSAALRHEILQRVVKDVGETCNLTIFHGAQVTYLDRVESKWPLRITFQPGSNVPAYCSASGKLFLALTPPAKLKMILQELRLERLTENTLTDRQDLLAELAIIRKNKYALDREEFLRGLVCVATPVFQGIGRRRACVAALALQAPVARMSCDEMLGKLPILQAAAHVIGTTLE